MSETFKLKDPLLDLLHPVNVVFTAIDDANYNFYLNCGLITVLALSNIILE